MAHSRNVLSREPYGKNKKITIVVEQQQQPRQRLREIN